MSYSLECQSTFCHPHSLFFCPYILNPFGRIFLFFIWENFLFYAVLVNHCCPFLKGWYGRGQQSELDQLPPQTSLHTMVVSLASARKSVTQPSIIVDVGLIALQMWGQIPTSLCSSPIRAAWDVFLFSLSLSLLRPHCFRRPRVLLCRESGRLCASRFHSHGTFWDPHLTKSSLTSLISQVQVPASFLLQIYFSCFFLGFWKKSGDIWWFYGTNGGPSHTQRRSLDLLLKLNLMTNMIWGSKSSENDANRISANHQLEHPHLHGWWLSHSLSAFRDNSTADGHLRGSWSLWYILVESQRVASDSFGKCSPWASLNKWLLERANMPSV